MADGPMGSSHPREPADPVRAAGTGSWRGVNHVGQVFAWATRLVDLLILLLALHILVVLYTGGYVFSRSWITIEGQELANPAILLLALIVFRFPLKLRTFSWDVCSSHGTAILTCLVLMVYLASGIGGSGDTLPARYLPLSILREGNFDLDEFPFLYSAKPHYSLVFVKNHYVSGYPVGAALLALPVYLLPALGSVRPESPFVANLEKLSAAAIVAASAAVLHLLLRRLTTARMAGLLTAIYALGTSSLSVSSRGLWQHGPSQLALTVALYCVVRERSEPGWAAFAGFPLAYAVISRPTDLLVVAPLSIYVLRRHRPCAVVFLLGALPPILFQLWYNSAYFGNPLRTQFPLLGLWTTPLGEGLAGVLASPGRGLFVYSPIFLFSMVGLGLAWRRDGDSLLRHLGVGTCLVILLYSKWIAWTGGATYGPRLLADLAPILALSLYPLRERLQRSRTFKGAFLVAVAWSIGAHSIGAFWDLGYWREPGAGDRCSPGLWCWADNQLVNPLAGGLSRAWIALRGLPTSRTAPELLSASYGTDLPAAVDASASNPLRISLRVRNEGRAIWLSPVRRIVGSSGVVGLAWLLRGKGNAPCLSGWIPIHHNVFPQGAYEFRVSIEAPLRPGAYLLELGMVSERVASFASLGIPPVRLIVHLDSPHAAGEIPEAGRTAGPTGPGPAVEGLDC